MKNVSCAVGEIVDPRAAVQRARERKEWEPMVSMSKSSGIDT